MSGTGKKEIEKIVIKDYKVLYDHEVWTVTNGRDVGVLTLLREPMYKLWVSRYEKTASVFLECLKNESEEPLIKLIDSLIAEISEKEMDSSIEAKVEIRSLKRKLNNPISGLARFLALIKTGTATCGSIPEEKDACLNTCTNDFEEVLRENYKQYLPKGSK